MKVGFLTLGCKVNQYETNGMIQRFKEHGYDIVEFDDKADIYIINTCTVTNMSDRKSRQFLRQAKKNNPDSVVVAVGCYVQVSKDELEQIPEINLCLGTNDKTQIVEFVEKYIDEKGAFDISKCNLIAYANGGYYALGKKVGKFGYSVEKKKRRLR